MRILLVIVIFFVLYIIVTLALKRKDSPSYKIILCFISYWFVSILMALSRVYGLRDISDFTLAAMVIGVLCFSFGYMSVNCRYNEGSIKKIPLQIDRLVENKVFLFFLLSLSAIVLSYILAFAAEILFYQSLSEVRTEYYGHEMYGPFFGQINAFLLQPFSIICLPVFAYQLLYKRDWKCIIVAFYLLAYYTLGAGRIDYVRIVLALVFLLFVFKTEQKTKKKTIVTVTLFSLAIFFLLVIISAGRKGEVGLSKDVISTGVEVASEHMVMYSAGPIAAFDYAVENNYLDQLGGFQHGNLTLTSVIKAINLFSSRLGITLSASLDTFVETKQENFISIGGDYNNWNALYTSNLFYYLDFGLFGIIALSFIMGLLFRGLIKLMYKFGTVQLFIIVNYLFFSVFCSVLDFYFRDPYVFLLFLILLFWGVKTKNSRAF